MSQAQVIDIPRRVRSREPRVDLSLAARVAEALSHAEHSLDQAFIATAELTVMLPSVRGQSNLAFCVPQDAIEAGTNTITSLTRARADLQRMHAELASLRKMLRVPVTAEGPGTWKPGDDDDGTGGTG